MRWIVKITGLAFLLLLLTQCGKKPLPESTPDQPDFYFTARINGEEVKTIAGENGYYMKSSHYLDTNKVYVMKAELSQSACNGNCGYHISILINDKKMSDVGEQINISEALKTGQYHYFDESLTPLYYRAFLKPLRNESLSEKYTWTLNGSTQQSYTASTVVENGKLFFPTLTFEAAESACTVIHQKQYMVGAPLQVEVSAQKEGPIDILMYSFNAQANGSGPFQYLWQFGDGSTSTSERPFHTFQQQGFYSTKLTLVRKNKDTCYSFFQVPAFIEPRCEANFTGSFVPIPNTKGYGSVTIQLTDKNGKVFGSRELLQPEFSFFELLEQSEYRLNDQGEPTRKLKLRFSCRLEGEGQLVDIQNAEAVIAVSY